MDEKTSRHLTAHAQNSIVRAATAPTAERASRSSASTPARAPRASTPPQRPRPPPPPRPDMQRASGPAIPSPRLLCAHAPALAPECKRAESCRAGWAGFKVGGGVGTARRPGPGARLLDARRPVAEQPAGGVPRGAWHRRACFGRVVLARAHGRARANPRAPASHTKLYSYTDV